MRVEGMYRQADESCTTFPIRPWCRNLHTHNLTELLDLAGLRLQLQLAATPAANPALGFNWQSVKDWSERARYEQKTEAEARELFEAVTDPAKGVLRWIKVNW